MLHKPLLGGFAQSDHRVHMSQQRRHIHAVEEVVEKCVSLRMDKYGRVVHGDDPLIGPDGAPEDEWTDTRRVMDQGQRHPTCHHRKGERAHRHEIRCQTCARQMGVMVASIRERSIPVRRQKYRFGHRIAFEGTAQAQDGARDSESWAVKTVGDESEPHVDPDN